MNKRYLAMLERAFVAEIEAATVGGLGLIQTRSKLAAELAKAGYLVACERTLGGRFPVVVKGYELTDLGRLTYCQAAHDREP